MLMHTHTELVLRLTNALTQCLHENAVQQTFTKITLYKVTQPPLGLYVTSNNYNNTKGTERYPRCTKTD